jgi:hypothetical protein
MMLILVSALAAAAQAPAATPAARDDDPIICTRDNVGSEVGTHMRAKKVCMKKSEREFMEQQAKRTMQSINNNGNDRQAYVPTPR